MTSVLARPALLPKREAASLIVGIGCAVLAAAVAAVKAPDLERLIFGLAYLGTLAVITAYDARDRRAPNRIVYPAIVGGALASLALGMPDAMEAWLGGLAAFVVMLAVAMAGRGAMGAGDVKVAALCGLVVGLHGVIPLLLVTFLGGAIAAAALLVFKVRRRSDTIAFTAFLVAATIACLALFPLYLWG